MSTSSLDLTSREGEICRALESRDLSALRSLSAQEGGFGTDRIRRLVWPFLLGLPSPDGPFSSEPTRSSSPSPSQVSARPSSPSRASRSPTPTSPGPPSPSSPISSSAILGESWVSPGSQMAGVKDVEGSGSVEPLGRPLSQASEGDGEATDSSDAVMGESWTATDSERAVDNDISQSRGRDQQRNVEASLASLPDETLWPPPSPSPSRTPHHRSTSSSSSSSSSSLPAVPISSSQLTFASPSTSIASLSPATSSAGPSHSACPPSLPAPDWGVFRTSFESETSLQPHQDESQIALDTRRSFVVYPVVSSSRRTVLQKQLHALIVAVFRRRPGLRYFQGYHDVASVFLLTFFPLCDLVPTLPPSRPSSPALEPSKPRRRNDMTAALVLRCLERFSVFRIRDGMGAGLEPVIGLLRLMKRILRSADPVLAKVVNRATPLPFFALSWLLTLFAHDVASFESISLVFDFLLARNPISVVYLAVAIVLEKKEGIERVSRELGDDDPGMLHASLSTLPIFLPTSSTPSSPSLANPSPAQDDDVDSAGPPLVLPTLFARTIDLMDRFPLDSTHVRAHEIMGPQSVIFTYEAEALALSLSQTVGSTTGSPSPPADKDTAADAMRQEEDRAELIVRDLPSMVQAVPPPDSDASSSDAESDLKEKKSSRSLRNRRPSSPPRSSAKLNGGLSKSTALAAVVVVGAVAFALYARRGPAGGGAGGLGGSLVAADRWMEWGVRVVGSWI